jgi:hypothetical protein
MGEKKAAGYALEPGVGRGEVFQSVCRQAAKDLEPELIRNLFLITHDGR